MDSRIRGYEQVESNKKERSGETIVTRNLWLRTKKSVVNHRPEATVWRHIDTRTPRMRAAHPQTNVGGRQANAIQNQNSRLTIER